MNRKGELIGVIGRELKNTQSETWMNYAIPVNAKTEIKYTETVKDKDGKADDGGEVRNRDDDGLRDEGMKGEYKPKGQKGRRPAATGGYHGIIFVPDVLERTPAYIEDVVPDLARCKSRTTTGRPRQLRGRRTRGEHQGVL